MLFSSLRHLGIHIQRYISSHGIALYCNNDLSWFDHVVPCGLEGKYTTSISTQLGKDITVEQVIPAFCKSFGDVFGRQLVALESVKGSLQLREYIESIVQ